MGIKYFLIICLISFTVNSQRFAYWNKTDHEHTSYLGSESVNPFIINQIQISINTKTEASLSISLKSNSGNTMIHKTLLKNKNGSFREVEYNAVIEKDAIYFTYPIYKKIEVFMEVSLNSASEKGKYNPMNWVVQDAFIEKFHEVAGKSDIFKRKEIGFDSFKYSSRDEAGNVSTIEADHIFSIPLLIGSNYYLTIFQNENKIISANASLSFKIPLKADNTYQNVETGLGFTINRTKLFKANKSFTFSFHGSLYHHELTKNSAFNIGGKKMTYKLSGLIGLNIHSKKNRNTYSFFSTLNKTSSRLTSKNYSAKGGGYKDQALNAATTGNEYFELGGNYSFHFRNKSIFKLELAFREDFNLKKMNNMFFGRNAEDFGVFLGFLYGF